MTGKELWYIAQAHTAGHLAGDGAFTEHCHCWLERQTGARRALLTHSCTAALEMAAILADLKPGDEVIMPSYTFVSTANAFVLRGAVPVFIDIRPDTMNIDETLIESAISQRTRAITLVHYGGVACELDQVLEIASQHGLFVIEDAAQGLMSRYRGRPLGSLGNLGTLSFHETKNVISGEGGALLVDDPALTEWAEIIRAKGTNRAKFLRGEVEKYTWVEPGSSYLPAEIIAAFLYAQMEEAETITKRRLRLWNTYHRWLADAESKERLRRPIVPEHCIHNAHMYYILLPNRDARDAFIKRMDEHDIHCVFHYVPLHSSPAGRRYGRTVGSMSATDDCSGRLVRLPLWAGLEEQQERVVQTLLDCLPD